MLKEDGFLRKVEHITEMRAEVFLLEYQFQEFSNLSCRRALIFLRTLLVYCFSHLPSQASTWAVKFKAG